MEQRRFVTVDGNEATANIAHLCCEVAAIYPITPSSDMAEETDAMSAADDRQDGVDRRLVGHAEVPGHIHRSPLLSTWTLTGGRPES